MSDVTSSEETVNTEEPLLAEEGQSAGNVSDSPTNASGLVNVETNDTVDADLFEGEFTIDEPKSKRTPLTVPKAVNIALIVIIVVSFSIVLFFLPKLFS